MWNWSNSKSLMLSSVVSVIVLVLLIAAAIGLPWGILWYVNATGSQDITLPLYLFGYSLLLCGFIAIFKLMSLLTNIKKGDVFVGKNISNLRVLSYCCLAVGLICFVFGFLRPIVFVLCFAAVFMGLILRVVKNVIARAVELREENDGTI